MVVTKIDSYQVGYYSGTDRKFVGPQIPLLSAGKKIATLVFDPNYDQNQTEDHMEDGEVILYYYMEDYDNIIDLLRNEKPMYLVYRDKDPDKPKIPNGIMSEAMTGE